MEIKDFIPWGHENAVKIDTLMAMTGLTNREVRKAIAESDAMILNMQDGKGYFRLSPSTKADIELGKRYVAQEKSRGWACIKRALKVDKNIDVFVSKGALYRFARELCGISQSELARQMGVTYPYVCDVEWGEIIPDKEYQKKFEELVGFKL